ncbi:MAG: hypothetical protein RLZZ383_2290 [Pseudomonadota bacterium]|jgi:hypothetical protein
MKRVLLAVGAVALVIALVVVVRGLVATVSALSGGAQVRPERERSEEGAPQAAADEAAPSVGEAERAGHKSVAARAEELGVTKHEIRERIATRKGHTLEEQREIWRERGDARKEARQGGRAEERAADREQVQRARAEIAEGDPTVRDAAQVLKQLSDVGDGTDGSPNVPPTNPPR